MTTIAGLLLRNDPLGEALGEKPVGQPLELVDEVCAGKDSA